MGFGLCLPLVSAADLRASRMGDGRELARGWAHVGAGGWSWLVEAEHRKRPTSQPPRCAQRLQQTSLRHQTVPPPALLASFISFTYLLHLQYPSLNCLAYFPSSVKLSSGSALRLPLRALCYRLLIAYLVPCLRSNVPQRPYQ